MDPELRPIYFTDDEIWVIRAIIQRYAADEDYIDPQAEALMARVTVKTDGIVNDDIPPY